jgi:biotin carboxyl carrier protein
MSVSAADPAANQPAGETLAVLERLIVAPSSGVFHLLSDRPVRDGDTIRRGDVVGAIQSGDSSTPVASPFDGLLMATLAVEGQRLRPGQPVAWLRVG